MELDGNINALFFEGDVGSIWAGFSGEYNTIDLPFAVGLMPLLVQNGVWIEDAFTGVAFTIPARNSPSLDISNMDFTFFAAFDKVSSKGVIDTVGNVADHNVNLYGVNTFIEAHRGYWEAGYAYTDGDDGLDDQSYHNLTIAHSRRFRDWFSNSVRFIWNFGQNRDGNARQTADGFLLLIENSLITSKPTTLLPYLNLFAGFDRPQSLARAGAAGGVLKNTGINFETDNLTGFPKLDDTANNTYGGALGIEYLFALDQQIVLEVATVQPMGKRANRVAQGEQYAIGLRSMGCKTGRSMCRRNICDSSHICYSQPGPDDVLDEDYHHAERVSVDLLKRLLPSSNYSYYTCGPAAMMNQISQELKDWGVPKEHVHYEAFGPATVKSVSKAIPEAATGSELEVAFSRSGKTLVWDGTHPSLLDFAEANGVMIDSGCRAGNCGTCLTAIRSGKVDYLSEPGAPIEEGSCLACIAVPIQAQPGRLIDLTPGRSTARPTSRVSLITGLANN